MGKNIEAEDSSTFFIFFLIIYGRQHVGTDVW